MDISPGSTQIASGSGGKTGIASGLSDSTACVWSLSTGQRLLGPWVHGSPPTVYTIKFSPDGRFIATATWRSISVHNSQSGNLVVNVPTEASFVLNHPLSWSSSDKHLFTVSTGKIICLDASTGATLSQWSIHGGKYNCIALASDGAFIAASSDSSVSFWDSTTSKSALSSSIQL